MFVFTKIATPMRIRRTKIYHLRLPHISFSFTFVLKTTFHILSSWKTKTITQLKSPYIWKRRQLPQTLPPAKLTPTPPKSLHASSCPQIPVFSHQLPSGSALAHLHNTFVLPTLFLLTLLSLKYGVMEILWVFSGPFHVHNFFICARYGRELARLARISFLCGFLERTAQCNRLWTGHVISEEREGAELFALLFGARSQVRPPTFALGELDLRYLGRELRSLEPWTTGKSFCCSIFCGRLTRFSS